MLHYANIELLAINKKKECMLCRTKPFLRDNDMTQSKKITGLIARLTVRKSTSSAQRYSWRRRHKKVRVSKTLAEKRLEKEKRAQRRKNFTLALEEAQEVVRDEAKKLRETFGTHSVDYYHCAILQTQTRMKGSRGVSVWNAYLSQEVKRLNESEFSGFIA